MRFFFGSHQKALPVNFIETYLELSAFQVAVLSELDENYSYIYSSAIEWCQSYVRQKRPPTLYEKTRTARTLTKACIARGDCFPRVACLPVLLKESKHGSLFGLKKFELRLVLNDICHCSLFENCYFNTKLNAFLSI